LKPGMVERGSFTVMGIEVRTNNTAGDKVIPRQWDRFFKEGLLEKIPNRADDNILAVYSDYASDHRGDYDYLIGARVQDGSTALAGMIVKVIPKSRYAVVTTDQGPGGKVVSEAWQRIWTLEETGGLGGRRTYKADFEVYDQRSRDPNRSQVDIYVGIE
jgi:predicted transcriptional regulator YdeE